MLLWDKTFKITMKSEKQLGEPGSKLFVGNIPPNCTEQDLAQLCKEHGNVVRADIVKNFAFVVKSLD